MCSSPHAPAPAPEKKPVYLRNPYLDGLAIGGGQAQGRNALRIDRATPGAPGSSDSATVPRPASPPITTPIPVPGLVIPSPRPRVGGGATGLRVNRF